MFGQIRKENIINNDSLPCCKEIVGYVLTDGYVDDEKNIEWGGYSFSTHIDIITGYPVMEVNIVWSDDKVKWHDFKVFSFDSTNFVSEEFDTSYIEDTPFPMPLYFGVSAETKDSVQSVDIESNLTIQPYGK